jgi:serine/threonine protein kinase
LVNDDGQAMLTDFGSTSVVWNPEDISQQIIRWCAPEVLGGDAVSGTRPTYASDVFSFGMVVLEVGSSGREKRTVIKFWFFLDLFRKGTI